MNIRQETYADHTYTEDVIERAFKDEIHSDQTEHHLVSRLRSTEAFIPELSLIAEIDNQIVGHILFTKIKVVDTKQHTEILALAPVSVLPAYQRRGVGSALIQYGHQIARALGYIAIALIGHDAYYPRFGYLKADTFDIQFPFDAPVENCMIVELRLGALSNVQGMIEYPSAFME